MDEQPRKKVVILGGGMAALTAAFELTNCENWQEKISEISIYQLGWRLGGKSRGGRNHQVASRIESLGSQIWFGCYDYAFRLVRQCYEELGRPKDQPLSDWQEAFRPQDAVFLYEEKDGQTQPWKLHAAPNNDSPGDVVPRSSPWQLIAQCTARIDRWWREFRAASSKDREQQTQWVDDWISHAAEYTSHLDSAVKKTGQVKPLMQTAMDVLNQTHQVLAEHVTSLVDMDHREQRLWILQDLALTAVRGALQHDVPSKGFDVLDAMEFRDWLKEHGASQTTLESSLLKGLYDLAFAYAGGDRQKPNLAAGVALRLLSRVAFEYKGSLFWTTPMGTADAVIAPLYEVLRRRGVRFHFFHRVQNLRLDANGSRVAAIYLDRQTTPKGEYVPLINVQGLPCWPNTPRYDLLLEGAELQKRNIDLESPWNDWEPVERVELQVEQDFDAVILGIPQGALPHCCSELIASAPEWQEAFRTGRNVATAVSQLWFNQSLKALGWDPGRPFLTAFQQPWDTWADATQALNGEDWNAADLPHCVAMLRGVLQGGEDIPLPGPNDYPSQQQQRIVAEGLEWLKSYSDRLWPGLHKTQRQLHWDYLVDPQDQAGEARFEAQYHRANINPSDLYVQSFAGTPQSRLCPGRAWFQNAYICGDWTRTGLNVGCLEAAVMSGLQAAAALRGEAAERELSHDW